MGCTIGIDHSAANRSMLFGQAWQHDHAGPIHHDSVDDLTGTNSFPFDGEGELVRSKVMEGDRARLTHWRDVRRGGNGS